MSNLIPVVRPDTNGRMVTRHVKPVQASAMMSSPSIPRVQSRELIAASGNSMDAARGRRSLLVSVRTSIPPNEVPWQRHTNSEIAELIRGLPDSVVEAFHAANVDSVDMSGMDKLYLARMVIKAIDCGTDNVDLESAIHYFSNSSSSRRENIDEFFEIGSKQLAAYPIGNLIRAVKAYDLEGFRFDPQLPIGRQDERTVQQCGALEDLHYAAERAEHWEECPQKAFAADGTLVDSRLAQMVVDYPERLDKITEVMEDRQTLDYDLISSILGAESQAMREGTL